MPFGNFDFKKPEFTKISDVVWDIPKIFKQGMRVPARIYATKKLIDGMDLQVYDQVTNVATLPGIQKFAFCMSDGHSGYGFPIGGVAAFDANDGGVISPGGIGFDINCLPGDSRISLGNGTWVTIKDLEGDWKDRQLMFLSMPENRIKSANASAFMKREEKEILYEITASSGRKIKVTKEHPILTDNGFIEARNLTENTIYVKPFSGVRYENTSDDIIVSTDDIIAVLDKIGVSKNGNGINQIINFLKKNDLDNIRRNSPKLPVLLKLMGFIFGDGCVYFTAKGKKGCIGFYGKKEDLDEIRKDLQKLGFKAQQISHRKRHHGIDTYYGKVEFDINEESLFKKSTALAALLVALGTPYGNKSSQPYRIPEWIRKAVLWHKRLFLASFFGAELSAPKTINKYDFYTPQLNMNKSKPLRYNAEEFLNDIRLMLSEFGITSAYPVDVKGNSYSGKKGESIGLRLSIHGNSWNLIKLYELIGYEYNRRKANLSALASNYLRVKETVLLSRKEVRNIAIKMYNSGGSPSEIRELLNNEYVSDNFINHSIWPDRSDNTRVPPNFVSFEEYKKNLVADGLVADKIVEISTVPFKGLVYDLIMNDVNHNFIADNIVTHNCGMRLVLTNLTYDQVKPNLKTLVDKFFDRVPAGVGSTGFVKLTKDEFRKAVQEGANWAVENDYGWQEDLERTELNGMAEWADNSKVSSKAVERGFNQIGTLGSGNHYLEIQVVKPENIHDEKLAKKWGLFPNQIVIMFHCGSRGFGHQVATDYLQVFLNVMERKYGIKILDRELACAPFNSPEGQDYFKAMGCGVNMSFANRQVILHRIREVFSEVFKQDAESLGLKQVFDVAHNRATFEKHKVDGETKELIVHRKGATGSYYPGREEIPKMYKDDGSPVIIGGSMETGSYLMVGGDKAGDTFCSTAHGSGRTMSRTRATKLFRGQQLYNDMLKRGIYVRSISWSGLAEEAGPAYKEIDDVIGAVDMAGISKKVCKLIPLGNVKG